MKPSENRRAKNHFKANLTAGQTLYGLWLAFADAHVAEVMATCGFDWLTIDGEHAPNDVRSVLAQLQALAPYPVEPVVRLVDHDPAKIKQTLDLGAQNLLIPMVESAEQAQALVRACRYPPKGTRGVIGLARASRWGLLSEQLHTADAEVCLLVQVETRRGLDQLEAILQVEGVDGVFFGPSDLSASFGRLGQPADPEVQEHIGRAIVRTREAGKFAGTLSASEAIIERHVARGCNFAALGSDLNLLLQAARSLRQRLPATNSAPGTG